MAEQLYSSTVMGPDHRSLPFSARKATERVKGVKEKSERVPQRYLFIPQTQNSPCDYIVLTFLKLR